MSEDNKPKASPRFGRRAGAVKPAIKSGGVSSPPPSSGEKGNVPSGGDSALSAAERRKSLIHMSGGGSAAPRKPRVNGAGARTEEEKYVSPLASVEEAEVVYDLAPSALGDEDSPLAIIEEWTDDKSTDTTLGLGAEGIRDSERGLNQKTGGMTKKRTRRFTLNERDVSIIRLLGKYRYGYRSQVERYCDRKDMSRRMTQLANNGFLRNEMVTQTQALWTPTQVGLDIAGLDMPALTHGKITPSTIAHTVGLLNMGIDLELGKENTNPVKESGWPFRYRREMNVEGSFTLEMGETIITERMIVQSWNRQKALYGGAQMRQQLDKALAWTPTGPGLGMFGPEVKEGNEWMFVMMDPASKTHTPDMVLARPRGADGKCQHVAIELELNPKSVTEWRRVLSSYKGSSIYKKVAYATHKRTVANSLKALNEQHIGMEEPSEFIVLKYIPTNRNIPFWG